MIWILYYFFYCKRCYLDRDNYSTYLTAFCYVGFYRSFACITLLYVLLLLFLITGYDQLILCAHLISFPFRINKDVITIDIIIILNWKHFSFKANDEDCCYCGIGLIVMCASCSGKPSLLRPCLHGVGDPGLVGLVSFVFTLWRTQGLSYLQYQLILSPEVADMKGEIQAK